MAESEPLCQWLLYSYQVSGHSPLGFQTNKSRSGCDNIIGLTDWLHIPALTNWVSLQSFSKQQFYKNSIKACLWTKICEQQFALEALNLNTMLFTDQDTALWTK